MGAAVDAAEPLVHIRSFRMDFGSLTVIRDLSFDVHAGETGLLSVWLSLSVSGSQAACAVVL